jgi:hypothetical protein
LQRAPSYGRGNGASPIYVCPYTYLGELNGSY